MKKTRIISIILLFAISFTSVLTFASCEIDPEKDPYEGVTIDTSKYAKNDEASGERQTSAEISENNPDLFTPTGFFEYDLNALMPDDNNYMFSPLSIKIALAMLANGASGETAEEILSAVGIDDLDKYNESLKEQIEKYFNNKFFTLNIANSIWLNADFSKNASFSEGFSNKMTSFYSAEASKVTSADAVSKINSWVKDKTNGKIDSIINSPEFLAALINAVYFKASWQEQFKETLNTQDTFTSRGGSEKKIEFMNDTGYYKYYSDGDLQLVRIPYEGGETAMYIILSDGKRADFSSIFDKAEKKLVQLSLPKFKIEYSLGIKDTLMLLGIKSAFDPEKADLAAMIENLGQEKAFVSEILHKTYITVDEKGTEAAAATAVIIEATGAIDTPLPIVFKADKPFTFIIRDDEKGEIIFMGEYSKAN